VNFRGRLEEAGAGGVLVGGTARRAVVERSFTLGDRDQRRPGMGVPAGVSAGGDRQLLERDVTRGRGTTGHKTLDCLDLKADALPHRLLSDTDLHRPRDGGRLWNTDDGLVHERTACDNRTTDDRGTRRRRGPSDAKRDGHRDESSKGRPEHDQPASSSLRLARRYERTARPCLVPRRKLHLRPPVRGASEARTTARDPTRCHPADAREACPPTVRVVAS